MPDAGTAEQIARLVPLANEFPWATYGVVATGGIVVLVGLLLKGSKDHRLDLAKQNDKHSEAMAKLALETREHAIKLVVVLEGFMRFFEGVQYKVTGFVAKQKREPPP